jgi:hypothetical protein
MDGRVDEVVKLSEEKEKIFGQVENLLNIGIALSAERNRDRLLEMIVTESRNITFCEAGTLYLKHRDSLVLSIWFLFIGRVRLFGFE